MVYALRRYCKRSLHHKSLLCWMFIAVMLISISTMILYDSELLDSDSLHPISTRWRNERLSLVVRLELETTLIQPQLGNHQVCNVNPSHSYSDEQSLQILIMIMSALRNFEAREAIRQTWANKTLLPPEARVFFMLGTTPDEQVAKMVKEESAKHNDIIVEDFLDSYNNLTYKTLFTLKWASKWCSTATHLLKTDDDMLILVDNLKERLRYIRNHHFLLQVTDGLQGHETKEDAYTNMENEEELNKRTQMEDFKEKEYGGKLYSYNNVASIQFRDHSNEHIHESLMFTTHHRSSIDLKMELDEKETKKIRRISGEYILGKIYHSVAPDRDKDSKWYLPWSLYPEDYLPDFASGTAYIIANGNKSQGAIKSILIESLGVKPAIPLEDAFITGIVAGKCLDLPLIDDNERFHKTTPFIFPWSVSHLASCFYYDSIAIHGMTPKDIITAWRKLRELKAEDCNTMLGFLHTSIYRFLSIFEIRINKI